MMTISEAIANGIFLILQGIAHGIIPAIIMFAPILILVIISTMDY